MGNSTQHKVVEVPGKYILIVKVDRGVDVGSLAIHNDKKYRYKYPQDNNHIVKCTECNRLSIDEHWRKITSHLPLNGNQPLNNTPVFDVINLMEENKELREWLNYLFCRIDGNNIPLTAVKEIERLTSTKQG